MRWRQALALGLLLSQGGEFGFVLFARAAQGLLITPERGEPVRRDRHAVDGDHAVPDDGHRGASAQEPERQGEREGPRASGAKASSSAMAASARRWRRCCWPRASR